MGEEKKESFAAAEEKAREKEQSSAMPGAKEEEHKLSPTWAQECIQDIDDWIESQGIYLRQ